MKARREYYKKLEAKPEEPITTTTVSVDDNENVTTSEQTDDDPIATEVGNDIEVEDEFVDLTDQEVPVVQEVPTPVESRILDIPSNITPSMALDRGGFAPISTGSKYEGMDRDKLSELLYDAVMKQDLVAREDLIRAGALSGSELKEVKEKERKEKEKEERRHTGGDEHFKNKEYVEKTEKIQDSNTIETIKNRYPEVNLNNVTSKDDWLATAVKSKDQGGLGLTGADAEAEWVNTRSQFDSPEISGTTGLKIGDRKTEVELGNQVYNEVYE